MNKFTMILIILAVCSLALIIFLLPRPSTIDFRDYHLEVAATDEMRERGLSGRDHLEDKQGMLFIFPTKQRSTFWMKDVSFPLDIIWLDENRVVDVVTLSASSSTDERLIPSHTSIDSADQVIELQAGTVQRLGLRRGSRVILTPL